MASPTVLRKMLFVVLSLAFIYFAFAFNRASHTSAQVGLDEVRLVRRIQLEGMDLSRPAGLAYFSDADAFQIIEANREEQDLLAGTDIVALSLFNRQLGSTRITAAIENPVNVAVDEYFNRLLVFHSTGDQLISISLDPDGRLKPATELHYNMSQFGLQEPHGMTVDPVSGELFILDLAKLRFVRSLPASDGSFTGSEFSEIDLGTTGLEDPAGLASDPTSRHLFTLDRSNHRLYELGQEGQVWAIHDLSTFGISDPGGMVFAPSGDHTDDPGQMSLYLADLGPDSPPGFGHILELSLLESPPVPASTFDSILIQTIDSSSWSPPSPDASGVVYLPDSDNLLVSDGEVEETPIFASANLYQSSLTGDLVDTYSTLLYSSEPSGITLNPENNHLFMADDVALAIHEVDPGPDGKYDTADDQVKSFLTSDFGSHDPEGVTFDPAGALFISDGLNNEVYRVSPGPNAIFDGVPPAGDDQVTSFDTTIFGLFDPEGIAFNFDLNQLYLVGKPEDKLFVVKTGGALLQVIDISAANAVKPAGLAYAPDSRDEPDWNIYIADRGVDNDNDPNENDGRLYEMTLPKPNAKNVAPIAFRDSVSTSVNAPVTINVAINDSDKNGNLDPGTANTACDNGSAGCAAPEHGVLFNHADGTFTYTPDNYFLGNDQFEYEICDVDRLCDTAQVLISVFGRQTIYISTARGGVVGGVTHSDEDILAYDTVSKTWSMYFDGSDLGLHIEGEDIDALHIDPDGSILFSLAVPITLPDIGEVHEWDIVRFVPTQTGENTAGKFELYFDGEDVGLDTSEEDIDALGFAPDGRLVISTRGSYDVGEISGGDKDLLIFTEESLGKNTKGVWEQYLDGSDVGLEVSSEDIDAVWIDLNGDIYLSTLGDFSVDGVDGDGADILICRPLSLGVDTRCMFQFFWDGLAHEFESQTTDAVFIQTHADLLIDQADSSDPVMIRQELAYTITVTNDGPDLAHNVDLVDTLPEEIKFMTAIPDQGDCKKAAGVVTCDLGNIPSGDSTNVKIVVTTLTTGQITNEVLVAWENKQSDLYINTAYENTLVSNYTLFLPAILRK